MSPVALYGSSFRDSIRYGFAVGKVRVLITRLFGAATYERLLDAPDFVEQKRILSDTPYGRLLEGADTPEAVERALDASLEADYRFLESADLPPSVVRFVRERYDFTNLKAVLKARAHGVRVEGPLSVLGTIPSAAWEGDLGSLPEPFGDLARDLLDAFEQGTLDEGDISWRVDDAMYARLGDLARESDSQFLREFARLLIDIANTKTIVRARHAGLGAAKAEQLMFEAGSVPPGRLARLYDVSPDELADGVRRLAGRGGPFAAVTPEALTELDRLDVLVDDIVLRSLRSARMASAGPEPVIAYAFARESEVATLRTLLIGKLSGLSEGTLRGRMREFYT